MYVEENDPYSSEVWYPFWSGARPASRLFILVLLVLCGVFGVIIVLYIDTTGGFILYSLLSCCGVFAQWHNIVV